jgi:Domain of unknown function(DUF2779)
MKSPKPERHILSKSTFMYGYQCPKRLWLHKINPELKDEEDEAQTAIFQSGTDVGLLARDLFPGGVDASPETPYLYQQSVADTARYIAQGKKVIYEAAFQHEGLLCAVDILVHHKGKWFAYEVKSTTKVKPEHLPDAAFQYYVISSAGVELHDFSIVHLNNGYIRNGALDINQLFTPESILESVVAQQAFIAEKAIQLKNILQDKVNMPVIEVGTQCDKPYPCNFQGFCFEGMEEEEPDYGKPYINKEAISKFLQQLEYPVYHMDFESWMTAVPEYNGHWPYRQVCFQYSVHVQRSPNAEPEHYAYLAEGTHSSSRGFIESLLQVLGTEGTVLVYHKGFEQTRLRELVIELPQYEAQVAAVLDRIVDLMAPFRSKHYRLPEMQGRYTIKLVLPALVPELSYDELPIGNGTDASAAFYNMRLVDDEIQRQETRTALLEYCKLDTLAMVKILDVLRGVC